MSKALFKLVAVTALLFLITVAIVNVECLAGAIALIVLFTITYTIHVFAGRWKEEKALYFTVVVAIVTNIGFIITIQSEQLKMPIAVAVGFAIGIILMASAIKAWFIKEEPPR